MVKESTIHSLRRCLEKWRVKTSVLDEIAENESCYDLFEAVSPFPSCTVPSWPFLLFFRIFLAAASFLFISSICSDGLRILVPLLGAHSSQRGREREKETKEMFPPPASQFWGRIQKKTPILFQIPRKRLYSPSLTADFSTRFCSLTTRRDCHPHAGFRGRRTQCRASRGPHSAKDRPETTVPGNRNNFF